MASSPTSIAASEVGTDRSNPASDNRPTIAAAMTNPHRYPPVADESPRNPTPASPPE
jgi:hypothetical protein